MTKPTTGQYFALDMVEMCRRGVFARPGYGPALLILAAGSSFQILNVRVEPSAPTLTVRVVTAQRTSIALPCQVSNPTFGGARYWFTCRACHRRCRMLYWSRASFIPECRLCKGLVYSTQRMSLPNQWERRARRIEQRLGGERADGLVYKPKRMHWRTFNRLMDEVVELNDGATSYRISRDRGFRSLCRSLDIETEVESRCR